MIDFPGAADETVDRGISGRPLWNPFGRSVCDDSVDHCGVRVFRVGFRRSFVCPGHVALIVVTQ